MIYKCVDVLVCICTGFIMPSIHLDTKVVKDLADSCNCTNGILGSLKRFRLFERV